MPINWGAVGTGAASGATVGSAFGPWGAAAGGIIGGGLGYLGSGANFDPTKNEFRDPNMANFQSPGYDWRDQYSKQQAMGAQGRQAFQAADSPWGTDQRNAAVYFRNQMMNQDPSQSLAGQQLSAMTGANIAQQRSLMASAGPSNAAMMARVGSQNIGRLNQAASGQTMMGMLAERNAAAGMYGNMANTARAQDQNMSQFNAGMQAQNRAQNDAYEQGMLGANQNAANAQQAGTMGYEGARTDRFNVVSGQPTGDARTWGGIAAAAPILGQALDGRRGASGGSTGNSPTGYRSGSVETGTYGPGGYTQTGFQGITSDERAKTNIKDGGKQADGFLDSIDAMTYQYKPEVQPRLSTGSYVNDNNNARENLRMQQMQEAERKLAERERLAKWQHDQQAYAAAEKAHQERMARTAPPSPKVQVDVGPATVESVGGQQLGVMAQDVQRTPMGQSAVVKEPQSGYRMITPAITGPVLAGLARLNERLKQLEGKQTPRAPMRGERQ